MEPCKAVWLPPEVVPAGNRWLRSGSVCRAGDPDKQKQCVPGRYALQI